MAKTRSDKAAYDKTVPAAMTKHGLKDSGERQTFDTGAMREPNLGRGRYDLISPIALREVAILYKRVDRKHCDELNHLNLAIKSLQDFLEGSRTNNRLAVCAYHCFSLIKLKHLDRSELAESDLSITCSDNERYDLIPPEALEALAIHYEKGIGKYSERNWEKGLPLSRHLNSAMRHLQNYLSGDRIEDHLSACVWNCFCIMHVLEMIVRGVLPETLDDLPNYLE